MIAVTPDLIRGPSRKRRDGSRLALRLAGMTKGGSAREGEEKLRHPGRAEPYPGSIERVAPSLDPRLRGDDSRDRGNDN